MPHIWHKKFLPLLLTENAGGGAAWGAITGTQSIGSVYGLIFAPKAVKNFTNWAVSIPGDWDGTSNFVLRYVWAQKNSGDEKDGTCFWTLHHWVCQDWDNPVGSKSVTTHATYIYGDEGTTDHCMHCGTFEMDLTGGTFGTVSSGHTLFMTFQMPVGATSAATAMLFGAGIEYMAHVTGPGDAAYSTQDKRGG